MRHWQGVMARIVMATSLAGCADDGAECPQNGWAAGKCDVELRAMFTAADVDASTEGAVTGRNRGIDGGLPGVTVVSGGRTIGTAGGRTTPADGNRGIPGVTVVSGGRSIGVLGHPASK